MLRTCRYCGEFRVGRHSNGRPMTKCCIKCKFNNGESHSYSCERVTVLQVRPQPPPAPPPAPPAAPVTTPLDIQQPRAPAPPPALPAAPVTTPLDIQQPRAQPRTPPSPPHGGSASSSNVVTQPIPVSLHPVDVALDGGHLGHRCILVTMGLKPWRYGSKLLEQNPGLKAHITDVTLFLTNRQDQGYERKLWGTSPSTQVSVSKMHGWDNLLKHVLGRILMETLVIVSCDNGHHRSVSVAEVACQRLSHLDSSNLQIELIHVDAKQCTQAQWNMLAAYRDIPVTDTVDV